MDNLKATLLRSASQIGRIPENCFPGFPYDLQAAYSKFEISKC